MHDLVHWLDNRCSGGLYLQGKYLLCELYTNIHLDIADTVTTKNYSNAEEYKFLVCPPLAVFLFL